MTSNAVRVWDLPVRVFHWSLVAFFTVAYFTGDEESQLHAYAGYVVGGLVVFRILWGFIGTRHARFSDFVYRRDTVVAYLKGLTSGSAKRYIGHTPAGGWMILALLCCLLITTVSGLQVYGLEGKGPLAGGATASMNVITPALADDDGDDNGHEKDNPSEELWEEAHEFFANLTVLLIALHIAGVGLTSLLHRENLVKAMITGRKENDGQ